MEYHEDLNSFQSQISDSKKWLSRLWLSMMISEPAVKTGKSMDTLVPSK
ncbi:hypothetical protein [Heyndrickxia acidicola]|uniref:Uncharacterized protein n=1 Tax=Heyndrickxia acidicola TaxID=209389 RepID=A0ABU6MM55_9BACI|nr:hypothetical protein [Heyndrickxia acidicola]MED1205767.1 hypothetical protein [Heyndrickxia acidicola]